jgi:predicted ArsR family transcriptional regulator
MVEAGRVWGRAAIDEAAGPSEDPVADVVELLDEVGFEPELRPGRSRGETDILLHACPFRAVAQEHPEIVCSVHLGLIRGALERLGAEVQASGLEPFVRPDLCIAHLSRSEAGS